MEPDFERNDLPEGISSHKDGTCGSGVRVTPVHGRFVVNRCQLTECSLFRYLRCAASARHVCSTGAVAATAAAIPVRSRVFSRAPEQGSEDPGFRQATPLPPNPQESC